MHAVIAILAVVLLIIVVKVDPVISLVIGSMYYGIAAGLGLETTLTTIVEGFGSIMADVGLLIGFGVLIGALLYSTGALQRFVELLLRLLGPERLPYVLASALTAVFPSIYVDVPLILIASWAACKTVHSLELPSPTDWTGTECFHLKESPSSRSSRRSRHRSRRVTWPTSALE